MSRCDSSDLCLKHQTLCSRSHACGSGMHFASWWASRRHNSQSIHWRHRRVPTTVGPGGKGSLALLNASSRLLSFFSVHRQLFFFYCVEKKKKKRVTSARPPVPRVQHLPRRRLEREMPPPLTENSFNQENISELNISQLVVSLRYLLLSPITTLSILSQPFFDGRSVPKTLQQWKNTDLQSRKIEKQMTA